MSAGAHNPTKSGLHLLEFQSRPWQRLYIDIATPIFGNTWLVYEDAYFKNPGAIVLNATTASSTYTAQLKVFSQFRLREQIVLDIGPPFESYDFTVFCKSNNILSQSAPYYYKSDGVAERFVQTFKDALKYSGANAALSIRLASEFLRFRDSSHSTMGASH